MTEEQLYLLQQASDRLSAAKILLNSGYTKDAASRAYYSIFYVAEAFLQGEGKSFSSHSAVISVFGRDFANVGKVPVKFHRMLLDAERLRHKADYSRRSTVSVEEALQQIVRAEQFLELGNRLIATPLYHQLYQQYVQQIRATSRNLSQEKLDQKVAFEALKSHSELAVRSILKHSLTALVQGDEYVQQTLAIAQSQQQQQQQPNPSQDWEIGD